MSSIVTKVLQWIDKDAGGADETPTAHSVDLLGVVPFIGIHLACLAVIWVGWSWTAVAFAVAAYVVRMFAITAFYHRYFSHRTFKTSRTAQFLFAFVGGTAAQKGALWWAAHHRHHHRHSDKPDDVHSPHRSSFLWSHVGWITSPCNARTNLAAIPDLAKFPELRFLNRFDVIPPLIFAAGCFVLGAALHRYAPQLQTNGWQMLVWGFIISTIALYHGTFTINSLCHLWGRRRYVTQDDSRNNFFLALITLGEGWHNNHHRYPGSTRQGFFWWEIDCSYYVLKLMSWLGIVWDLNPVPAHLVGSASRRKAATGSGSPAIESFELESRTLDPSHPGSTHSTVA